MGSNCPPLCTDKNYVCSHWSQCIDGWQSSENCKLDSSNCWVISSAATQSKIMTRECIVPTCAESDYKISDWGQCVHGIMERAVTKSISCNIPQIINIRKACSPSICQENSYNIVWTKCVDNKQYSSFIKNEDCVLGYVPPAEKDCVSPIPTPKCQESSFSYGAWTPCVNNTSMRVAVKKQKCIGDPVISKSCSIPDKTTTRIKTDGVLTNKLKGKILLQIESCGEAYYVNPKDGKSYYMADGNSAYSVMRNLGVGITNDNLNKINTDKNFAKKNAGKIFLQVEASGEAYYIDFNGEAHYLKDGTAAYGIMRDLGLGITNSDLSKIAEGNL